MIKVCHITSAHSKQDVRIFHKECVSLSKAGYDVTLVQQGTHYEKDGVHLVGFGEIPTSRIRRMLFGAKIAYRKALEVNADVYHLHDPELLPYGLKLKKKGKKVIFDSHEHTAEAIYEKEWLPKFLRSAVYTVYAAYQKKICKQLDAVISVTPNIIAYFQKINPNTVQVANYPVFKEPCAAPSPKQSRVVFAGGISDQWNHHTLLNALDKVPECGYCLCGIASESYLEQLKTYPAWQKVNYLGKIPHSKVADELAVSMAGIALLQPGRNTDWDNGTIGNTKIFEEMLAGLPVICTDFVLWKEFVQRYHCGICVKPDDAEQIASAIRYLLEHPEEAKQMGENGRRAVKEEFNWGVEETKLLALYKDILNN